MQKYVTPHPGRTPAANIVDRPDYKLNIKTQEFRAGEHVLTIDTFIPEHGWISKQWFLTEDELVRVQEAINGKN
jgi:hypothetical protein